MKSKSQNSSQDQNKPKLPNSSQDLGQSEPPNFSQDQNRSKPQNSQGLGQSEPLNFSQDKNQSKLPNSSQDQNQPESPNSSQDQNLPESRNSAQNQNQPESPNPSQDQNQSEPHQTEILRQKLNRLQRFSLSVVNHILMELGVGYSGDSNANGNTEMCINIQSNFSETPRRDQYKSVTDTIETVLNSASHNQETLRRNFEKLNNMLTENNRRVGNYNAEETVLKNVWVRDNDAQTSLGENSDSMETELKRIWDDEHKNMETELKCICEKEHDQADNSEQPTSPECSKEQNGNSLPDPNLTSIEPLSSDSMEEESRVFRFR